MRETETQRYERALSCWRDLQPMSRADREALLIALLVDPDMHVVVFDRQRKSLDQLDHTSVCLNGDAIQIEPHYPEDD